MTIKKQLLLVIGLLSLAIFSLNSCKKNDPDPVDPCATVACYNGGICVNGTCVCPQGYTGPSCETPITPSIVRINKIEVTRYPANNAGVSWDPTNGPDIYPEIKIGQTSIWASPYYSQDANSNLDYEFIPSPEVDLTSTEVLHSISLYDYDDLDADDFMGLVYFKPYYSLSGFPTVITVDAGGPVAFRLHISYVW